VIGTVILGLLAGWITGLVMRGSGYGVIADIILGLVGAVLGRWIFRALGIYAVGTVGHLVTAVVGAIVLVAIVHALRR
jgi:uncharacterized membrane protein YeaQ/YmgE (transglycosylase-associated protein family)